MLAAAHLVRALAPAYTPAVVLLGLKVVEPQFWLGLELGPRLKLALFQTYLLFLSL